MSAALTNADQSMDVASLSEAQLDVLERQIAAQYMRIVPWGAVAWGLSNLLVWLALWPLVLMEYVPLWLAFPVATLNVMLCYLPSHEAQHNIIGARGSKLRWLNELVGHLSTIPMTVPFRVLRHTHLEHHAHTNDPQLDPDHSVNAPNGWLFVCNTLLRRQPGAKANSAYTDTLQRIGKGHMILDAVIYQLVYLGVLVTMAWTGHAIEAALLWWLPRHVGLTYIEYYLSWAPHHPGKAQGRYHDTRAFRSRLGNALSFGMQYHIVHHLYPRIPLSKTPAAYRALKPILQRRGCNLGDL